MIPHTLQLKNFLSYGPDMQTIDFRPYQLMYLSGKNGHGKSALLDAMTWAVWGIARKVTTAVRADQGLLRVGQTEMVVIFDFEVNGQRYRVKREFLKSQGKSLAQLEFGLLNEQTNEFIPLTDKTIRATQTKIEKTIKLEYDSFVNTAFLRQGNANEFSKKSPKDRKEILSTILGLQQFDLLKKRALEKIKKLLGRRQAITTLKESLEKQLTQKTEVITALEEVDKKFGTFTEKEKTFAEQKGQLAAEKELLVVQQKKYELCQYKQEQLKKTITQGTQAVLALAQQWRLVHKKQRSMPSYAELEKKYEMIQLAVIEQEKKLQDRLKLQQERIIHTEALQQRKAELEKKVATAQQELQIKIEKHAYEHKALVKQQQDEQAALEKVEKEIKEQQGALEKIKKDRWSDEQYIQMVAQFEKRKEAYHSFVAQKNMLQSEQEGLANKQGMVQDEDPSCPLCEQNLSAARKKFLRNKCVKEATFNAHRLNRLLQTLAVLKKIVVTQHDEINEQAKLKEQTEALVKENTQKDEQLSRFTKQLLERKNEIKKLEQRVQELEKKKKEHQIKSAQAVEKDAQYLQYFQAVDAVEKQLEKLKYDQELHKRMRAELGAVEKEKAALFSLQQEVHTQHERMQTVSKKSIEIKQYKKDHELLIKEQLQFKQLPELNAKIAEKLQLFEQSYKLFLKEREESRELQGALKSKRDHLLTVEKENKQQQEQVKQLDVEIGDYQEIAVAAGKDGIQALLIEDAIPEIEQEANQLLSKLTNNQSQIFIESLRDLKRGGTKETLDINISDAIGIRPYELFSGGEAFRIDFALRIAISKLLARRAGTSLQTLIIDEGFGSQDEEGLSLIMDAIYKIQDDFEKVIVVSHLPSMRDQFPVHLMVEKGPSGSYVQIVEQG